MTGSVKAGKPTTAKQKAAAPRAKAGPAVAPALKASAQAKAIPAPAKKAAGTRAAKTSVAPSVKAAGRTKAEPPMSAAKPGKKVLAHADEPTKQLVAARAGTAKVKLNKRSSDTIARILAATEEIVLRSGAERISILDVCQEIGISRGTFYRYFSSQDDLLDAFSRHKRDQFHATLQSAAGAFTDPDQRFEAVLQFVDDYLEHSRAGRLLLVAPEYATRWFQRIFHDSVHRFQDILSIVFDAWEERRGVVLDRELICELMVRYILSDVLVPSGPERRNLMRRIERFVTMLLSGRVARR